MASRGFWLSLLSAAAPLCLSSCELAVDIIVVQLDDGRISIETDDGGKYPPCIHSIDISLVVPGEAGFSRTDIWSVSQMGSVEDAENCRSKIVYPEIPPHYRGSMERKMEAGKEYRVSVSGAGFDTRKTFVRRAFQ
jgi:hypothetical protein